MAYQHKGVIIPMVTPFTEGGELDDGAVRGITEHLIACGVHGLFPIGSTGEFFALDVAERGRVLKTVIAQARGRVPVWAGTGAVTTRDAIRLTQQADALGADGFIIITPYYITPSQDELYEHYAAIARSTDKPVIPYNNPGRTSVNVSAELMARLWCIENIVGIKDSSNNIALTAELINCAPPGVSVFQGQDAIIYPSLAIGAVGAIAATGNAVAREVVEIYEAHLQGDRARAMKAQEKVALMRKAILLGTFPVVLKEAMVMQGIPGGHCRPPARALSEDKRRELRASLERIGVLQKVA